jgi:serine/threonine protein kinase
MLVMLKMDIDLRKYLQQNHNILTWKERIHIISCIVNALSKIHQEKAVHRDLHSGNILIDLVTQVCRISDLGFCGPVNKPLDGIYGNLPYMAPEIITRRESTFKSDIYSIGMLMWEISSGQPPFVGLNHDYNLAMDIVNGKRPNVIPKTPSKYKTLMEQCWDANQAKRPNVFDLSDSISEINRSICQNDSEGDSYTRISKKSSLEIGHIASKSKIHKFKIFSEPRNATEGMSFL